MTIYDRPTRFLMRDMLADFNLGPGQTFTRATAVRWFARRYPKLNSKTVYRVLCRLSVNDPGRVHHTPVIEEDDILFRVATGQYRLYDPDRDGRPIRHR